MWDIEEIKESMSDEELEQALELGIVALCRLKLAEIEQTIIRKVKII